MTQPLGPPPQETPPPSSPNGEGPSEPIVNPTPESRLDQLAAEYALLKPQAEAKTERLKELTDAIKAELASMLPEGATSILLTSPHLLSPLRLEAVTTTRLDTKAIKAAVPEEAWRPWSKATVSWRLAAARY